MAHNEKKNRRGDCVVCPIFCVVNKRKRDSEQAFICGFVFTFAFCMCDYVAKAIITNSGLSLRFHIIDLPFALLSFMSLSVFGNLSLLHEM